MYEKVKVENAQLAAIKEWCDEKQRLEDLEIKNPITGCNHDYFREFFTEFNIPNSVGLKTAAEVIAQNKSYNDLYCKHRDLILELKYLKKTIEYDLKCGRPQADGYKAAIKRLMEKYDFTDNVNEELMKRGVKF